MNDEEEGDSEVIAQCLRAAADGPFFPDWEFTILFGFERDEVRRIAECWPNWGDEAEQARAVDAAMNNLLCYPHNRWDRWHNHISPVPPDVARVYARWRGENDLDTSGRGYFDRLT
jgi:hypothetical protein